MYIPLPVDPLYMMRLLNLALFGQFKKREKHPLRSVAFSKLAG